MWLVLVLALLVVTLPAGRTHAAEAVATTMSGSPGSVLVAGDYGNGRSYVPEVYWEGHDTVGWSQTDSQLSVSASAMGAPSYNATTLTFRAVPGEQLRVGHYAISDLLATATSPGMSICPGGSGCGYTYGEFDILDLAPDRLWLTFHASGSSQDGAGLFGEVRFGEPITGNVLTIPTRLQWTPQALGETNDPVPVTLVNLGDDNLTVSAARATGANAADLTVGPVDACSAVAPGAACHLDVAFQPGALGARSSGLSIVDSRGGHTIGLTGAGRPGPPLATTAKPTNNHYDTCGYDALVTGPDTVTLSWSVPCKGSGIDFFGIHYLIRGAVGSTPPAFEADGFPVYSGHVRSASISHLDPTKQYSFTLFTQYNDGGDTVLSRSVVPVAISINADFVTPAKGAQYLVTGTALAAGSALARQPLQLRATYPGSTAAVVLATTTTDDYGAYSFRIVPTRPASYAVTYTPGGDRAAFGGTSPTQSAPLFVKVSMKAPKGSITYKKRTTISAAITPVPARTGLLLQIKRKGTWQTLAVAICSAKGAVSFSVKLKDKGTYSYRVYWQGSFGTYAAASNTVKIKVK